MRSAAGAAKSSAVLVVLKVSAAGRAPLAAFCVESSAAISASTLTVGGGGTGTSHGELLVMRS